MTGKELIEWINSSPNQVVVFISGHQGHNFYQNFVPSEDCQKQCNSLLSCLSDEWRERTKDEQKETHLPDGILPDGEKE